MLQSFEQYWLNDLATLWCKANEQIEIGESIAVLHSFHETTYVKYANM